MSNSYVGKPLPPFENPKDLDEATERVRSLKAVLDAYGFDLEEGDPGEWQDPDNLTIAQTIYLLGANLKWMHEKLCGCDGGCMDD